MHSEFQAYPQRSGSTRMFLLGTALIVFIYTILSTFLAGPSFSAEDVQAAKHVHQFSTSEHEASEQNRADWDFAPNGFPPAVDTHLETATNAESPLGVDSDTSFRFQDGGSLLSSLSSSLKNEDLSPRTTDSLPSSNSRFAYVADDDQSANSDAVSPPSSKTPVSKGEAPMEGSDEYQPRLRGSSHASPVIADEDESKLDTNKDTQNVEDTTTAAAVGKHSSSLENKEEDKHESHPVPVEAALESEVADSSTVDASQEPSSVLSKSDASKPAETTEEETASTTAQQEETAAASSNVSDGHHQDSKHVPVEAVLQSEVADGSTVDDANTHVAEGVSHPVAVHEESKRTPASAESLAADALAEMGIGEFSTPTPAPAAAVGVVEPEEKETAAATATKLKSAAGSSSAERDQVEEASSPALAPLEEESKSEVDASIQIDAAPVSSVADEKEDAETASSTAAAVASTQEQESNIESEQMPHEMPKDVESSASVEVKESDSELLAHETAKTASVDQSVTVGEASALPEPPVEHPIDGEQQQQPAADDEVMNETAPSSEISKQESQPSESTASVEKTAFSVAADDDAIIVQSTDSADAAVTRKTESDKDVDSAEGSTLVVEQPAKTSSTKHSLSAATSPSQVNVTAANATSHQQGNHTKSKSAAVTQPAKQQSSEVRHSSPSNTSGAQVSKDKDTVAPATVAVNHTTSNKSVALSSSTVNATKASTSSPLKAGASSNHTANATASKPVEKEKDSKGKTEKSVFSSPTDKSTNKSSSATTVAPKNTTDKAVVVTATHHNNSTGNGTTTDATKHTNHSQQHSVSADKSNPTSHVETNHNNKSSSPTTTLNNASAPKRQNVRSSAGAATQPLPNKPTTAASGRTASSVGVHASTDKAAATVSSRTAWSSPQAFAVEKESVESIVDPEFI